MKIAIDKISTAEACPREGETTECFMAAFERYPRYKCQFFRGLTEAGAGEAGFQIDCGYEVKG